MYTWNDLINRKKINASQSHSKIPCAHAQCHDAYVYIGFTSNECVRFLFTSCELVSGADWRLVNTCLQIFYSSFFDIFTLVFDNSEYTNWVLFRLHVMHVNEHVYQIAAFRLMIHVATKRQPSSLSREPTWK